MGILDEALAVATAVRTAQKSEGIWLADHPFVQAVRVGIARQEEIGRWARQFYCLTRCSGELLQPAHEAALAKPLFNAQQELEMLIQLGNALGLTKATMANSEANPATRSVKEWMRKHIIAPDKSDKAQICMALVEGMSPEAGAYLAEGAEEHYGLRADQIQYFTLRMRSKHDAGKDAAQMLSQLPIEQWDFVRDEALIVSRLVDQMYNSVGDMWSSW